MPRSCWSSTWMTTILSLYEQWGRYARRVWQSWLNNYDALIHHCCESLLSEVVCIIQSSKQGKGEDNQQSFRRASGKECLVALSSVRKSQKPLERVEADSVLWGRRLESKEHLGKTNQSTFRKVSSCWGGHTHTHPFNGPLSRTTRVSRYPKGKPIWILLKQETVSGSGICWAICKSAPRSRQITTPATHHSVFYRPDALPAAQPTASKH